jgi:4-cresol dehydrogenase (hydroxylating)
MMASTKVRADTFNAAVAAWSELLGVERVVRSGEVLQRYGRTTLPDAPQPVALLRPSTKEQISPLVKIAAQHGTPLYPISQGKNWGWGDACPPGEGQVLLDLSGLDQIVEINEELGYVVVQPGVTQGQVVEALAQANSSWWLDCTAAGPSTSLIGNTLERGITREERISQVSGMEVVLADGSLLRTGYGHFSQSRVTHIARWGIGPSLDGLFSQSSLGIVTELGFWLQPMPAHALMGFYTVADEAIDQAIDALRPLRMRGVIAGQPAFLIPGGLWFGLVTVQGSVGAVAAHRAEVEAALATIAKVAFPPPEAASDSALRALILAQLGLPPAPFFDERLRRADPLGAPDLSPQSVLMFLGGPQVQGIAEAPTSIDPRDHDYGFYFLWPTCPALGREVRALLDIVRGLLAEYNFPPLLTLRFMTGRSLLMVVRVVFDRKSQQRCEAARKCHAAILDATIAAGYLPARVGIEDMEHLDPGASTYWQFVRRLKQLLDPQQIIAPGRYLPSGPEHEEG